MAFAKQYRRQVALLVQVLPLVTEEECFALKGGTAINLFIRNMPSLSVDIDLTYLRVTPRPESLAAIDVAMKRIAARIGQRIPEAQIAENGLHLCRDWKTCLESRLKQLPSPLGLEADCMRVFDAVEQRTSQDWPNAIL